MCYLSFNISSCFPVIKSSSVPIFKEWKMFFFFFLKARYLICNLNNFNSYNALCIYRGIYKKGSGDVVSIRMFCGINELNYCFSGDSNGFLTQTCHYRVVLITLYTVRWSYFWFFNCWVTIVFALPIQAVCTRMYV